MPSPDDNPWDSGRPGNAVEPGGIWFDPRRFCLTEGYRCFRHEKEGRTVYEACVVTSREKLLTLLLETTETFGEDTGIVVLNAHHRMGEHPEMRDFRNTQLVPSQLPVIQSVLAQSEKLLFDDGYFSLCIDNRWTHTRVQLDPHKILIASDDSPELLEPVLHSLRSKGIHYRKELLLPHDPSVFPHDHNILADCRRRLCRFIESIGDPFDPAP